MKEGVKKCSNHEPKWRGGSLTIIARSARDAYRDALRKASAALSGKRTAKGAFGRRRRPS